MFNVGGGAPITVKHFAETVAEVNGYIVLGELTDIIITEDEKEKILH